MKKARFDNKPRTFEKVDCECVRYNYNIAYREAEEEGDASWECDEVTVFKPLSANKITEAVIEAKWGLSYEQKLINEFNAAQLGLVPEDEAQLRIKRYKQFLTERASIKAMVDKDCEAYSIR